MRMTLIINSAKVVALSGFLAVAGCSTVPVVVGPPVQPPLREYKAPAGVKPLIMTQDPLEGFNRGAYRFNYYFDKYLFIPVVRSYEFILPVYAQNRVSSFVNNIGEIDNLLNNILQGKVKSSGITVARFACNTTVGIAGLWDPASRWGMRRQEEDLGQTLGAYGVGNGPYLVLPVLGPSNARDTVGMAGDTVFFNAVAPAPQVDNDQVMLGYSGVDAVDTRHRVSFRYQQMGSPFEYELVRMLYTMKRDLDVDR